ncbi:hypothetical protein ACFIOY_01055 [Bradyrhizobium sp. TZ2]
MFTGKFGARYFEDMGSQSLKNIAEPMRVWRVPNDCAVPEVPNRLLVDHAEPLALPDRPSIAVLPFQNMSGDPDQDYFADGMVDEITTALSRFKPLFVIARNSSFAYKGKAVDIKQVGRELGVRYVLEGSVRKAAGKVRIIGQLIDAATGVHLWADRFEGDLSDIFALQDRMTESVVSAIEPKMFQTEIDLAVRRPKTSAPTTFVFEQYRTSTHLPGAERPRLFGLSLAHWKLTLGMALLQPLQGAATCKM